MNAALIQRICKKTQCLDGNYLVHLLYFLFLSKYIYYLSIHFFTQKIFRYQSPFPRTRSLGFEFLRTNDLVDLV